MDSVVTLSLVQSANPTQNDFSYRIETLLNSRGCSKAWLAKELGISKQALNYILKRGKKPKFVSELALIFNVKPRWLETGQGKAYIASNTLLESVPLYKLTEILSCNTISGATCLEKILLKKQDEHQYFAILFDDYPSMSTKFDKNATLIFDQHLKPKNGDYVLVSTQEEDIVFRRFYEERQVIVLKPADSDYDSVRCKSCHVLGTLIETRVKF